MFQYSEADIRKVKRLQFGILGPDEIKAMSVCHIESDRTFEGGKPVANGLMDPRLGSIDREINCTTCGMDRHECPGHFGHIELAKPMYHVSFITNIMKARARSRCGAAAHPVARAFFPALAHPLPLPQTVHFPTCAPAACRGSTAGAAPYARAAVPGFRA
jgi:DNA-directed RNA polymerase II subunit RPB1